MRDKIENVVTKDKNYRYLRVSTGCDCYDQCISLLWEFDLAGICIDDSDEDVIIYDVYPAEESSLSYIKAELERMLKAKAKISEMTVSSILWQGRLEGWFEPVDFYDLRIIPYSFSRKIIKDAEIYIYPGRGYGTGNHATTSMCIELLKEYISDDDKILDFGTGSGILSICALKWGASEVFAIDNDEDAVENAMINIKINKQENHIKLACGSVAEVDPGNYDLIVANLNSWIIEGLLGEGLAKLLHEDNKMILSGIRIDHVEKISESLKHHDLEELQWKRKDKWTTVVVQKKRKR